MNYSESLTLTSGGGISELSYDVLKLVAAGHTAAEIAGAAVAGAGAARTVAWVGGIALGPEAAAAVLLGGAALGVATLYLTK